MNIYDFEQHTSKKLLKRAAELLLSDKTVSISEDEPFIYEAVFRSRQEIFTSIEVNAEGDIIDIYCTCNKKLPCVHITALLMGLALMDAAETGNIEDAKKIIL